MFVQYQQLSELSTFTQCICVYLLNVASAVLAVSRSWLYVLWRMLAMPEVHSRSKTFGCQSVYIFPSTAVLFSPFLLQNASHGRRVSGISTII